MVLLLIGLAVAGMLTLIAVAYSRKAEARIARIRRVKGPPHARISYMNMRGKRYTWKITVESVRRRKQDWVVTAWCHEKKELLVFYVSRMYACPVLQCCEEIKNVPAYFSERFVKQAGVRGSVSSSPCDRRKAS